MITPVSTPLPTYDTEAIKSRTDLLDLIGGDTRLRRIAGTRGGEYAGPCPFCGGHDRLRVQPEQGLWWCRSCSGDHWQDAIAYVMRREGVPFADACAILGGQRKGGVPRQRRTAAPPSLEAAPEPSERWRARGVALVQRCARALWSTDGQRARAYLHGRGLTDATIRRAALGWNPAAVYDPREAWGLDPAENDGKRIWTPRGITVPWTVRGKLWGVKVRRPDEDLRPENDTRYVAVSGSSLFLYGGDTLADHRAAVLCEGELDALLLEQEAGDLAGVATLGGAKKRPELRAVLFLLSCSPILLAHDTDAAGDQGATMLAELSARMQRAQVPLGKDLTDFRRQGGNLREWVRFHLERHGADVLTAPPPGPAPAVEPPPAEVEPTPMRSMRIVWAEERGWLKVRDPFTGEWHQVHAKDCPESWIPRRRS